MCGYFEVFFCVESCYIYEEISKISLVVRNIYGTFGCYIEDVCYISNLFMLKEMHKVIAITYILLNGDVCSDLDCGSKMDAVWQNHFQACTFLCYHHS